MWILTGASESSSCCASVFTATKSTCAIPASIIRFTALIPAPPTPTTRITARYDATSPATWSRGGLSGIGVTKRLAGGAYGSTRSASAATSGAREETGSGCTDGGTSSTTSATCSTPVGSSSAGSGSGSGTAVTAGCVGSGPATSKS